MEDFFNQMLGGNVNKDQIMKFQSDVMKLIDKNKKLRNMVTIMGNIVADIPGAYKTNKQKRNWELLTKLSKEL